MVEKILTTGRNVVDLTTYRQERSEEHTSELQSRPHLVCRLLLEKKNNRAEARARCEWHPPPMLADRASRTTTPRASPTAAAASGPPRTNRRQNAASITAIAAARN